MLLLVLQPKQLSCTFLVLNAFVLFLQPVLVVNFYILSSSSSFKLFKIDVYCCNELPTKFSSRNWWTVVAFGIRKINFYRRAASGKDTIVLPSVEKELRKQVYCWSESKNGISIGSTQNLLEVFRL